MVLIGCILGRMRWVPTIPVKLVYIKSQKPIKIIYEGFPIKVVKKEYRRFKSYPRGNTQGGEEVNAFLFDIYE